MYAHGDIINKMGILAELYALGDCAFVGGALHYQVHNVLEPFAHNIPIAYGNLYKNSHEAISLAEKNLATIVTNPQEMLTWFLEVNALKCRGAGSKQKDLDKYLNISETIYQRLNKSFIEYIHD